MKFSTLAEIKAHKFIGNHAADWKTFDAIEEFAANPANSIEDRAEALWTMGREGMGLDPDQNLEHWTPTAMVGDFMEDRANHGN